MKSIPVIVLTAEKNAELKALQMGASDFITKPFDMHEVILARVSRIIELSEGRQLISAAEHDKLTMLYSRNFFLEYANRIYTYHPELHLDAVVLNIEQFHTLNDLHGREFGNAILKKLGDEIRSFLAETSGIASRFDSDRFHVFCQSQNDYAAVLDRIQKGVNEIARGVSIHIRMGVDKWHEGVDPVLLFDRARTACNMVRGDYQHPLMIYDDNMRQRELLNQRLLNDLDKAVEEQQLAVFYQPKYDVRGEKPMLSSAEALIRWNHPELGMISPGTFIPLFEGNGLISIVDRYVWGEAARQIAEWRDRFGVTVPVSVNVSRADIFEQSFVERMKKLVVDNGLGFSDLKLEITESSYTDNAKYLVDIIGKLRETGFEIEMDDFGSGYSSLNMLSSMPIDVLKMDMKFVRNIELNETDRRLVSLILDIAKYLGATVVAEGVETDGQLEILRRAGCDIIQGYYFSRPLPAKDFGELIECEIKAERIIKR